MIDDGALNLTGSTTRGCCRPLTRCIAEASPLASVVNRRDRLSRDPASRGPEAGHAKQSRNIVYCRSKCFELCTAKQDHAARDVSLPVSQRLRFSRCGGDRALPEVARHLARLHIPGVARPARQYPRLRRLQPSRIRPRAWGRSRLERFPRGSCVRASRWACSWTSCRTI